MRTLAKTQANRSNALKSTGPRTPEGKAVVVRTAVKQGLLSREALLQDEDRAVFRAKATGLREHPQLGKSTGNTPRHDAWRSRVCWSARRRLGLSTE